LAAVAPDAAGMIVLRQAQDERAWVDRLTAKALAIAEARATRRNHPTRWRRPGWLWPLFAKER